MLPQYSWKDSCSSLAALSFSISDVIVWTMILFTSGAVKVYPIARLCGCLTSVNKISMVSIDLLPIDTKASK